MGYILYYNIYISYLYLGGINISDPIRLRIENWYGFNEQKSIGPLGASENPNRLKPEAWLWSPTH